MKHLVNDNYFTVIDTEDKAYFLGLVAADGCIIETLRGVGLKRKKCSTNLCISLVKHDGYLLDKFKEVIEYSGTISYYKPKERIICGKQCNIQDQALFRLTSQKICEDLSRYNIVPRKSLILQFPPAGSIPDSLIHHFIRGYFDGDGTYCKYANGRHVNPQFQIKFYGNFDFLLEINLLLIKTIGMNSVKLLQTNTRKESIHNFSFGGNSLIKKFYTWLYKDATIFMKRKEEGIREVFDYIPYSCRFK